MVSSSTKLHLLAKEEVWNNFSEKFLADIV
jgi:hypothetical protein